MEVQAPPERFRAQGERESQRWNNVQSDVRAKKISRLHLDDKRGWAEPAGQVTADEDAECARKRPEAPKIVAPVRWRRDSRYRGRKRAIGMVRMQTRLAGTMSETKGIEGNENGRA